LKAMRNVFVLVIYFLLLGSCSFNRSATSPSIKFITIPPSDEGGPGEVAPIKGRVTSAGAGQKIVLYAHSGIWWIQPKANAPFTDIAPDLTWENSTHLGFEYAALLIEPGFQPPAKLNELPVPGNGIVAVAVVPGTPSTPVVTKTIEFSGYEWNVKTHTGDPGGTINFFEPDNVWTDDKGFLHLRIANDSGRWTSAEIKLSRSLGYGTYKFVVEDTSQLEPAAVFGIYTWDDLEAGQNHREMNIDVSQWGDPDNKNLQYVIQPHIVPANVVRFNAPPGILIHTLRWEPGKAAFKSVPAINSNKQSGAIVGYDFMSGIPTPGAESIHLNLYVFGRGKMPLHKENEVVIEKFEYFP
jgi:hypothetical protein